LRLILNELNYFIPFNRVVKIQVDFSFAVKYRFTASTHLKWSSFHAKLWSKLRILFKQIELFVKLRRVDIASFP